MKELNLSPTEAELARINELCPEPRTAEQCSVVPVLAFDQALTAYYTRADESWIKRALDDVNGPEGVSFLKHHDKVKDPVGRVFEASLGSNEHGVVLNGKVVLFDNDMVEKYKNGSFKAVSACVASSWLKCSVCGNEWLSHACFRAAEDADQGLHWPGKEYNGEKCFLWHMADADDEHAGMLELSAVYKGASNGRFMKPGEVERMYGDFVLECGREDADPEALKDEFIAKAKKKFQNVTLEFPVGEDEGEEDAPGEGAGPGESNAADDPAELRATVTRLQGEATAQEIKIADLARQVADLGAARESLKGQIEDFKTTLKERKALNAEMRKNLDEIKRALPDPAVIETDEALAAATCSYISMARGLREAVANRIEKLDIQLNGDKAEPAANHAAVTDSSVLLGKLDVMEKEVAKKYGVPPLTAVAERVGEDERPGREDRRYPARVYQD